MNSPYFVCLFTRQLFLVWGNYECCREHSHTIFCTDTFPYGRSKFKLFGNWQTFPKWLYVSSMDGGPSFVTSSDHLVLSVLWIIAILVGMLWYLIPFLISISPMTNDVESLFMWLLLEIHISSLKCPFKPLPICFLFVILLSCTGSLYVILDISLLSAVICKYFLLMYGLFFRFLIWCLLKSKHFKCWLSPIY